MRRQEKILLHASALWSLAEGMLGPLFAIFTKKIGGSILDISWIWAGYMISTGLFMILIGKISDNKKNKKNRLLVLGYTANTLFTFAYLLINSQLSLFLVEIGLGLSMALASPTWDVLYERYCTKKNAGLVWGLAEGEEYIISGIAIFLGGFIVNKFSFNTLFVIMGFIQLASTIYLKKHIKILK